MQNIPKLRSPILIAAFEGWNDAGEAASMAAKHIIERWKAPKIATIEPEHFYDFISTRPVVGFNVHHQRTLSWPSNSFYTCVLDEGEHDIIIFLGVEPNLKWRTFCEQVIDAAKLLGVSQVITLGSLLSDVLHNRPVEVYGSSSDEDIQAKLKLKPSDYQGPTGIVGVLGTQSRDAGLSAVSLWSAVPSYVSATPSPKASLALVKEVSAFLDISVFATDLELAAETYEREVAEFVAEDDDMSKFVSELEDEWERRGALDAKDLSELADDSEALLAEVENYLRENG